MSQSPAPFWDSEEDDKGYIRHAGEGVEDIFGEEIPETPSPRTLLQPGDVRRLELLIRNPGLNGQYVVLETYDQAKKRWNVRVGTERKIAVKDTNLAPRSQSPSPIPGPKGPMGGMFVSPSPVDDDGAGDEEQEGGVESSASPLESIRKAKNDGCYVVTFPPNSTESGFRASWELTSDEEKEKQKSVEESKKQLSDDDVPLVRRKRKK